MVEMVEKSPLLKVHPLPWQLNEKKTHQNSNLWVYQFRMILSQSATYLDFVLFFKQCLEMTSKEMLSKVYKNSNDLVYKCTKYISQALKENNLSLCLRFMQLVSL